MNKKDLSKIKYIHHIYSSEDRVIHCERHAVIYINSTYVYYKLQKKDMLNYIKTKNVVDKFSSKNDLSVGYMKQTDVFSAMGGGEQQ